MLHNRKKCSSVPSLVFPSENLPAALVLNPPLRPCSSTCSVARGGGPAAPVLPCALPLLSSAVFGSARPRSCRPSCQRYRLPSPGWAFLRRERKRDAVVSSHWPVPPLSGRVACHAVFIKSRMPRSASVTPLLSPWSANTNYFELVIPLVREPTGMYHLLCNIKHSHHVKVSSARPFLRRDRTGWDGSCQQSAA